MTGMKTIFIIHGSYGNPQENWFPWLKQELEKVGCQVIIPHFPTPKKQSLQNWRKVFKSYEHYLNEDSIIIGHSLGAAFLLTILEQRNTPIRAAFFIAGFIGSLENPTFDKINNTFVNRSFRWEKIKKNCRRFTLFHADNDPYVSLFKAQELAAHLETAVTLVNGAGHFNTQAGYTTFPLLLQDIKKELSMKIKKKGICLAF